MPRPNKIWFRKDTGWWMVTIAGKKIRLAEGRQKRKEAEQKFHELMLARHVAPEAPTARVADFVEAFLETAKKRCSFDTYRNYRFYCQKLAEACGTILVSELKPIHITRWVDSREWNETTKANARRVTKRVFSWAKSEGIIPQSPLDSMVCPRGLTRSRALTESEFRTIVATSHGPFRILVWTLRQTGARPCELRRLVWDEVHTDRWVIPQHKTAKKTRKPRVIYLTPAVQRLMNFLRPRSRSRFVFVNTRGKPWTTNAIRQAMSRIKSRCGLEADVCSYLIRHTFGTFAVMNGLNSSEVAELMGHTSTEMIDRVYVHLADQVPHLHNAALRATRPLTKPAAVDSRPGG